MADEDDPMTSTSRTPLFADREGGPPDAPDPRDQEDNDDSGLPHDRRGRRRGGGAGGPKWRWWWKTARGRGRALLASREKHFAIMAMVSLDVVALLVDILVSLVACDWGAQDEPWVGETQEATKICGLVFSCLFLAELAMSVWAFGVSYFYSWFHCFDAAVIVVSFVVDLLAHGIAGQIASLVIVLRLTRLVKIVNELSLASAERMEGMETKIADLERQNSELKRAASLRRFDGDDSDAR